MSVARGSAERDCEETIRVITAGALGAGCKRRTLAVLFRRAESGPDVLKREAVCVSGEDSRAAALFLALSHAETQPIEIRNEMHD